MLKRNTSNALRHAESATVLATWAQLAYVQPDISWAPVSALIGAVEQESRLAETRLNQLLDQSDGLLGPLCDPLRANVGLHRWLSEEREEAYSDWLAWTLERLGRADLVMRVLGFTQSEFIAPISNEKVKVAREKHITAGRLDLDIRFGRKAMLVVEVKKTFGEEAATAKQAGYDEWIDCECEIHNLIKIPPRLLVLDDSEEVRHGFTRLRWTDLCIELRSALPELLARSRETPGGSLVEAAMVVAFIAAVEQNLLHLSAPGASLGDADWLLFGTTCGHLEKFLERLKGNGKVAG
jgi:hypothetical protein